MNKTYFIYNNLSLGLEQQVTMKLVADTLFLADFTNTNSFQLNVPLKKCHYNLYGENAHIYLGKSENEYVLVPSNSSYFIPLISLIDMRKKNVIGVTFNSKVLLPVLAVLLIIFLGYVFFTKVIPSVALKCVSHKQEISIGNRLYKSFVEDAEIDTAKTKIAQEFANKLHLSTNYPIRVTVLKDSVVNAFAFPGGNLVIYTGILNQIENPEELVALLAHESSHVNNRHNLKAILSNFSSTFLISLLTQGSVGGNVIISKANNLQLLSYSRDLEREADREGMKLMVSNNINPIGMKWLMENLRKQNEEVPSSISFLSNHPLTDERIKNASSFSSKYVNLKTTFDGKEMQLWEDLKINE